MILTLTVEIDEEGRTITVRHGGQEYLLQSLALFGGDAKSQEIFIKMFGASADAAWAYAQGYRIAHSEEGGPALKSFYKQCAAHVCKIIDPNAFKNEIEAEELLNKWECADQTKWAGWDTEDVLADKQLNEDKKKWN
jgi:hypothetical protein